MIIVFLIHLFVWRLPYISSSLDVWLNSNAIASNIP